MMKSSVKEKIYKNSWSIYSDSMDSKQTKKFYNQKNVSFLVKKFAKFAKKMV